LSWVFVCDMGEKFSSTAKNFFQRRKIFIATFMSWSP